VVTCRHQPHDAEELRGATYVKATGHKCRRSGKPLASYCLARWPRPLVPRGHVSRPVRVLELLTDAPPQRVATLAAALGLDTSRTSEAVEALRKRGEIYQPLRGLWARTP